MVAINSARAGSFGNGQRTPIARAPSAFLNFLFESRIDVAFPGAIDKNNVRRAWAFLTANAADLKLTV